MAFKFGFKFPVGGSVPVLFSSMRIGHFGMMPLEVSLSGRSFLLEIPRQGGVVDLVKIPNQGGC